VAQPTRVDAAALADQTWHDPARGSIRFRTLISAPVTDTDALVFGVAMLSEGDTFPLLSHAEAEVYYGLEGTGEFRIDGVPQTLAPGVALYIPGGAVHGMPLAKGPLKWAYAFAADSFSDIHYSFAHETADD
jgi:quercetin dioxygenase-like cupin family protein